MIADEVKNYVEQNFSCFGQTRRQEITRLLFEIAKREKLSVGILTEEFSSIVKAQNSLPLQFDQIKNYLLRRRYPKATHADGVTGFQTLLTAVDVNPELNLGAHNHEPNSTGATDAVPRQNHRHIIFPKNIFIEESVRETPLAKRLQRKFPLANRQFISTYRDYIQQNRYNIKDYNTRTENFFIVRENYDFFSIEFFILRKSLQFVKDLCSIVSIVGIS